MNMKWLTAAALLPLAALAGNGSESKPNIIVILADDLGYGDCGVCNPESKIKTPNIDQLAAEGLLELDGQ